MADPVSTQLTSGDSTLATTTVSFSSVAVGTLLTLHVASDDYKTGNPSGWTVAEEIGSPEASFHGSYFFWKISDGTETSVQYVIGSASKSSYVLIGHTNIQGSVSKDVSAKQNSNTPGSSSYTTPSSGTTTAGRRYGIGHIVGHATAAAFSLGSWTNSYTQIGVQLSAGASPFYAMGVAGLAFDGGGATSTGATFSAADTSNSGIISVFKVVPPGPAINTQPQNVSVYDGDAATFTVSATTSGGSLSYQWKDNGSNVGTNAASYSGVFPLAENGHLITCDVTDSNGTKTTAAATVTVYARASSLRRQRQSSTFDYSGAGWFDVQLEATGQFDRDMIVVSGSTPTGTLGEAQAASQAAGRAVFVVAAVAQAAAQAVGRVTQVTLGQGQAAGQAAGGLIFGSSGVAQSASQAVAGATIAPAGSAQSASQAQGAVVDSVAGQAQAASQAGVGTRVQALGAGQSASQAGGGVTEVAAGVAQAAAQAAGATSAGVAISSAGAAQAAAQAAGSVATLTAGSAQAAGQAGGAVVEVAAGQAQAAGQAAGKVTEVALGQGQAASQGTGGATEVVGGVAQSASQAVGVATSGSTVLASGGGQAAAQAAGAVVETVAGSAQSASQTSGGVVDVTAAQGQGAGQAAGAVVESVAGQSSSASQAAGGVSTGTTLLAAGAAQSASQAVGAVSETLKGEGQAAGQAVAKVTNVTAGEGQAPSQAGGGATKVKLGVAQSISQAEGAAPIVITAFGVSAGASQAAGVGGLVSADQGGAVFGASPMIREAQQNLTRYQRRLKRKQEEQAAEAVAQAQAEVDRITEEQKQAPEIAQPTISAEQQAAHDTLQALLARVKEPKPPEAPAVVEPEPVTPIAPKPVAVSHETPAVAAVLQPVVESASVESVVSAHDTTSAIRAKANKRKAAILVALLMMED